MRQSFRALIPGLVLIMVALSGCFGGEDAQADDAALAAIGATTEGDVMAASDAEPALLFKTDLVNGTAPLNVTFTAEVLLVIQEAPVVEEGMAESNATSEEGNETAADNSTADEPPAEPEGDPYGGNFTWTLDFGDGDRLEGNQSTFPLSEVHAYNFSSNFTTELVIELDTNETLDGTILVQVEEPIETGPAPAVVVIHREYTDQATVGVPYTFCAVGPEPEETCPPAVSKAAYDNGANGTFVLGYEITIPEGARKFTSLATAPVDVGDPTGFAGVPDYDMYVFDSAGTHVGTAADFATEHELAEFSNPAAGTWTVVLLYFLGGPEGTTSPVDLVLEVLA